MARPRKQTVDYFPHDTDASDGKTLTIIQARYGNDGYAFWFKLLQVLGKSPGHYYDFNNHSDLEFLCAKTHQKDTETILAMLKMLADLKAIDKELFEANIIWSQNFVDRVLDAYGRTVEGTPQRPDFLVNVENSGVSVSNNAQSANRNSENPAESAQKKVKETKLKESKEDNTSSLYNLSPSNDDVVDFYREKIGEPGEDMENELKLAAIKFSASWVIDAIEEAVKRGKTNWRYIARILENWRRFGKKTNNKQDPDKFVKGKYGNSVQR